MASSARKVLIRHLKSVLQDKKAGRTEKQNAAKDLAKMLTWVTRQKMRKEKVKRADQIIAMQNKQRDEKLARGDMPEGKKATKKYLAKKIADGKPDVGSEWSGFIPKARVLPFTGKKSA